jgi:hypothetical protein
MSTAYAVHVPFLPCTVLDMADDPKKRGPSEGMVRMTFDMKAEDRARLKVCAALASQAEGKPVTMGQLLDRWAREGMAALEKKLDRRK